MFNNSLETDYDHEYFSAYPYEVVIMDNECCTDSYRSDSLSDAQAKFDSWEQDLSDEPTIEVKMYKYNETEFAHDLIDYNGNIIED